MQKYIFLIPLFLFACKKEDKTSRISARQQPSKIAVFSVDTVSGVQTLQYEINYFYNDSTEKFDSIIVGGIINRFDYSRLATENKILLNYTDSASGYNEIIFNPNFYTLNEYNEIPPSGSTATNLLQYDTYKRVTNFIYSNYPSAGNFSQTYSYNFDSTIIHTLRPYDGCETNDTITNSFYDMSTTLPYLLFTNINNNCGTFGLNILRALPLSNYSYKLPYKMVNNLFETSFSYTGDSNSRLAEAVVVSRLRINNQIFQKLKIVVSY